MANNDNFLDNIESSEDTDDSTVNDSSIESREMSCKEALEQAQRNILARKRIDDLLEKKRLKELLDDSDDW